MDFACRRAFNLGGRSHTLGASWRVPHTPSRPAGDCLAKDTVQGRRRQHSDTTLRRCEQLWRRSRRQHRPRFCNLPHLKLIGSRPAQQLQRANHGAPGLAGFARRRLVCSADYLTCWGTRSLLCTMVAIRTLKNATGATQSSTTKEVGRCEGLRQFPFRCSA